MSQPKQPSAEQPIVEVPALALSLGLLSGVAVACAARLPGFPIEFVYAFLVSFVLRIVMGRGGDRLAPSSVLQGIGAVLVVVGMLWIFPRRGPAILVGVLAIATALQSLFLLGRFARPGVFTVILTANFMVVGTGLLVKDPVTLYLSLAYTVVLLWVVLLLERGGALARDNMNTRGIRRVRFLGRGPLPALPVARAMAAVVLIGFPIGLLVFHVVPRPTDAQASRDVARRDAAADAPPPRNPFEQRRRFAEDVAFTGMPQDTGYVEFGSVGRIKESHLPVLQVFRPDGRRPERVYLRDNVMDHYLPTGALMASPALKADQRLLKPDAAGWFALESTPRILPQWRRHTDVLLIQALQKGFGRWFLMPWPMRARLLRGREPKPLTNCRIFKTGYHTLALRIPGSARHSFRPGDWIELEYVSQRRPDEDLTEYRSDPEVSPLSTYVQLPGKTRRELEPIARKLVADETDPWERARILEAWLKAPPFEYALAIPTLDPNERIVDFVVNVKRGNCELYAMALMAMLRTLGHPTRYARGFWGGDALGTPEHGSIVMRNSHYHAWVELYLDELGWVALNPTPPDRRPLDAQESEHEEDPASVDGDLPDAAQDEPSGDAALLEFGSAEYDALWTGVGQRIGGAIAAVARFLFSGRSGFAGVWLLAMILTTGIVIRRRQALRESATAAGGSLPRGPYGRALLLLAKQGIRRPAAQTPSELVAGVAVQLPIAAVPLGRLTGLFERERYGGESGAASGPDARKALGDLQAALDQKQVRSTSSLS